MRGECGVMGLYFETIRLAAVEERRGTVTPGDPLRWLTVGQVRWCSDRRVTVGWRQC